MNVLAAPSTHTGNHYYAHMPYGMASAPAFVDTNPMPIDVKQQPKQDPGMYAYADGSMRANNMGYRSAHPEYDGSRRKRRPSKSSSDDQSEPMLGAEEAQQLLSELDAVNSRLQMALHGDGMYGNAPASPRQTDVKLYRTRDELLNKAVKRIPGFVPPADFNPPKKLIRKIYVPVREHPNYNFMGALLGPRGMTQKKLEQSTGAKIAIRGKGSMKEGKGRRDGKPVEGMDDELHVVISAESEESLDAAVAEIERLLVPIPDEENHHKRLQLAELARLNGTYRDFGACGTCGEKGHSTFKCPKVPPQVAAMAASGAEHAVHTLTKTSSHHSLNDTMSSIHGAESDGNSSDGSSQEGRRAPQLRSGAFKSSTGGLLETPMIPAASTSSSHSSGQSNGAIGPNATTAPVTMPAEVTTSSLFLTPARPKGERMTGLGTYENPETPQVTKTKTNIPAESPGEIPAVVAGVVAAGLTSPATPDMDKTECPAALDYAQLYAPFATGYSGFYPQQAQAQSTNSSWSQASLFQQSQQHFFQAQQHAVASSASTSSAGTATLPQQSYNPVQTNQQHFGFSAQQFSFSKQWGEQDLGGQVVL